jgi:anchored repeat ABC transporter substrate-binding protein
MNRLVRKGLLGTVLLLVPMLLAGCSATGTTGAAGSGGKLRVVTTTEILADLVKQVGKDRVDVSSLVPAGGDPHSYEPTPADASRVAKADVTFTNHLLLEEQSLIKTIDANARKGAPNVSLAEGSESYGADVIPLVEDLGLDVLWLGLRVSGKGTARGATRSSSIRLSATDVKGPGSLVAYLTESLGQPDIYFNSADGFDQSDLTTLPPAAHTHLNWAFTKPGIYTLTLAATLDTGGGKPSRALGSGTFTFAVGVDPAGIRPTVLDDGHTDLTVDLDTGQFYAYSDIKGVGKKQARLPADQVVIDVPNRALETVPDDPRFAFLGKPGARIHQLPQAVLGKHVHGEIDPHLWQNVENARAYTQLIRDTLIQVDPDGRDAYAANTAAYVRQLNDLDTHVRDTLARIPVDRRQLITTHDAFGYLAKAYDLKVAGFVVPNPAQEPSAEQVQNLTDTIRNLGVPAVFMEPNLVQRASVLKQVASDLGVNVCTIYGDAFDRRATTYVAMMRHNADELLRCLGGENPGAQGAAAGTAIADGHVDLGPRFVNGDWTIQVRDDTVEPAVWRDLDSVVLAVNQAARVRLPDDPVFGFLGKPGDELWLLPQVQKAGVLWPGWNTQDTQVAKTASREVTWTLHGVQGPGTFVLFLNEEFGKPSTVFDSRRTMPQETGIDVNTHVHGNWAFTRPGTYLLDISMTAPTSDGQHLEDRRWLRLHVGPGDARTALDVKPTRTPTEPVSSPAPAPTTSTRVTGPAGPSTTVMVAGGALVALLLFVAALFVRSLRKKERSR